MKKRRIREREGERERERECVCVCACVCMCLKTHNLVIVVRVCGGARRDGQDAIDNFKVGVALGHVGVDVGSNALKIMQGE